MFELRWLEKETGRQLQNDWGYFYYETTKVLQYRQLISGAESIWSEWKDVPTISENSV